MRTLFTKSALVAALVTLVPAAALASTARVQSMGLQGDFIQDYSNVYAYPSSIVRYQNLVYGDLGNKDVTGNDLSDFEDNSDNVPGLQNSGRAMGAYLNTWKWLPGTWGIQINENNNTISQAYGAGYYDRNRNSAITLMWGNKVGGANLGLMLEKANSSIDDGNDVIEPYTFTPPGVTPPGGSFNARRLMNAINAGLGSEDRNSWGVGAGVTFNWSAWEREHQADIAVHYRDNTLNIEDAAAGQTLEDNGNTSISVNARAQLAISDNSYLTPVVNYYSIGRGTKFTDSVTPANNFDYDNSVTGWQIGLAESWVLRESDLLVMGLSVGHESIDYEDPAVTGDPFEVSYETTPTIFGALEVHPVGWWHVRMGAGKPIWSKFEFTDHDPAGDAVLTVKDSPLQYAFGTGFRLGNRLDIDAVVNQDFAFTGSWGASGTSETPFSSLSMTYRF